MAKEYQNLLGKVYKMDNVRVTVREFTDDKTGEPRPYLSIEGEIGGCRQKLKSNIDSTFMFDFLARYCNALVEEVAKK